jgi:hypothetical protein
MLSICSTSRLWKSGRMSLVKWGAGTASFLVRSSDDPRPGPRLVTRRTAITSSPRFRCKATRTQVPGVPVALQRKRVPVLTINSPISWAPVVGAPAMAAGLRRTAGAGRPKEATRAVMIPGRN